MLQNVYLQLTVNSNFNGFFWLMTVDCIQPFFTVFGYLQSVPLFIWDTGGNYWLNQIYLLIPLFS